MMKKNETGVADLKKEELIDLIKKGEHPQFVLDTEQQRVVCRCGHAAIWHKTGYICGTITAYPCKYN